MAPPVACGVAVFLLLFLVAENKLGVSARPEFLGPDQVQVHVGADPAPGAGHGQISMSINHPLGHPFFKFTKGFSGKQTRMS